MQSLKDRLADFDVMLCGLAFTSRTETLEDYLKGKAKSLSVVAISSCFLKEGLSRVRLYEKGALAKEFSIPNFRIKDYRWYRQPLVVLVFLVNWFFILRTAFRLGKKFDLYIGVSSSFAFAGALLKAMGRAGSLMYYCIDYYIPPAKLEFNSLFVRAVNLIERFVIRFSDHIWDLTAAIKEQRQRYGRVRGSSYRSLLVPLGYRRQTRRSVPFEEINRWDIGFVGTVSANQGLEIMAEAMPEVLKRFPLARVKVIGQGPYLEELRSIVSRKGLEGCFTFFGFIEDEEKVLWILSRCAAGLALYTTKGNDNIVSADTGKPKLYCVVGLPPIVTASYLQQEEIERRRAGVVIKASGPAIKSGVIEALSVVLGDDARLKEFRRNAYELGGEYISDAIFDRAFADMKAKPYGV